MSKEARSILGLSDGEDSGKEHVHVPASEKNTKQAPEHKKGLELYDNKDTRSNLGEGGSHGSPDSKKSVGGTYEGSKGGASFADGNPKLTSKDVNEKQRNAQKERERLENGG